MNGSSKLPQWIAPAAIRLVGVWVLLGGLAKLFVGTPNDLPLTILRLFSDPDLAFRLVIAGELAVASAALITPRLSWPLVAALMVAFLVVLGGQIAAGKTSCGCFGGKIQVRPQVMFGIDLAALLAVLAARPWSQAPSTGVRLLLLAPVLLLAVAAPWLVIPPMRPDGGPPATKTRPATGSAPSKSTVSEHSRPFGVAGYFHLDLAKWIGRPLSETDLAKCVPPDKFEGWDRSSTLVFYRLSCEECAKHLERLAKQKDTIYVLVRVPDVTPKPTVVKVKPDVPVEVALPEGTDWVVHVPAEVVLDKDGKIEKVTVDFKGQ